MSFGDLGRNFDSVLTIGAGPVAFASDVACVVVRDDTDRITSLNRRFPADCRSSTIDVTMPVTTATQAKTPMIASMSEVSMAASVLDVHKFADDQRASDLQQQRDDDHLAAERVSDQRLHVIRARHH